MKPIYSFRSIQFLTVLCAAVFPNVLGYPKTGGSPVNLTYSELKDIDLDCGPFDTCVERDEPNEGYNPWSCDCDSSCAEFDTCCIDSEFRTSVPTYKSDSQMKCLPVYGNDEYAAYMVDSCRHHDADVDHLCRSNGEDRNDPLLTVPVTSAVTGITYKNYFCSVCNENLDAEQIHMWNLELSSNSTRLLGDSVPRLRFNTFMKSWTVVESTTRKQVTHTPVFINVEIPNPLYPTVRTCQVDVISECAADWTDEIVRQKCKAYMARVSVFKNGSDVRYRNPHCAICNFEDINTIECTESGFPPLFEIAFIRLFLLGDKDKRCKRHAVYDNFAKRCRCNSRKYVMRNGSCISRS